MKATVTTVDVQHPEGIAFVLVRIDESCPDPDDVVRAGPGGDERGVSRSGRLPVMETLGEHCVTGHDVEFFSLDVANAAASACFRTPRRTVLVFGQWSDLGGEGMPESCRGVFRSLEELED